MIISPYLIAIVAAWPVAQGTKYIVLSFRHRRIDHLRQLYLSGNMPSAHSATVMSLTAVVALSDGIDSGIFAVVALMASIVMYDAMMVRRSVGEQGRAIQQIIKKQKVAVDLPRAAKGHTPMEVLAGALLGVIVGVVVFYITN